MNVVPGHLAIYPSGSGCPNSENELLIKGSPQQLQHLVAFGVVWQIRFSPSTTIMPSRIGMLFLRKDDSNKQD